MASDDLLPPGTDPMPPGVAAHLAALGIHGRPARKVLALLLDGWQPLAGLIRGTALPRRGVEELLAAAEPDLDRDTRPSGEVAPGGGARPEPHFRIRPDRAPAYRPIAEHRATAAIPGGRDDPADPLLGVIAADIAAGPPPTPAMDHVPADPETVLRRARWLDAAYCLDGARVLVLGDHDLTSLALCAVRPGAAVTVVDLDERVLAHVDRIAAERGFDLRCLHADLRFGLPPSVAASADLVFSDPPYTPEGMGLFAGRAVDALRDPITAGRLVLAYGYSDRSPALGLAVQRELSRLGLVFAAVLPAFHTYHGAQAIGSAADLYVCQPTSRARQAAGKRGPSGTGIYTHGPQSVESAGPDAEAVATLHRLAADGGFRVVTREPGWARPVAAEGAAVAADLTADPGPWLLRTLLGTNAARLALLVPNNHADLTSAAAQGALAALVAAKWRLRFRRSTPGPEHAIVVAEAVTPAEGAPPGRTTNLVLHKAHGKLGNVWREAVVTASGGSVTKNEARQRIAAAAPPRVDLGVRLIDLPRHQIAAVVAAIPAPLPAPSDQPPT